MSVKGSFSGRGGGDDLRGHEHFTVVSLVAASVLGKSFTSPTNSVSGLGKDLGTIPSCLQASLLRKTQEDTGGGDVHNLF